MWQIIKFNDHTSWSNNTTLYLVDYNLDNGTLKWGFSAVFSVIVAVVVQDVNPNC